MNTYIEYGYGSQEQAQKMEDGFIGLDVEVRGGYFKLTFGAKSLTIYNGYITATNANKRKRVPATDKIISTSLDWMCRAATDNDEDFCHLAQWMCCLQYGSYDRY